MAEQVQQGAPEDKPKKAKKLTKDLGTKPGTVIITATGGSQGAMEFMFKKLPPKIQELFGPFGLGHKLGDAAAGREGKDAESAIAKVWEGLLKGDWSVRAPAVPKISLSEVATNYDKLSPKEQEVASKLLASLGIDLPGAKK